MTIQTSDRVLLFEPSTGRRHLVVIDGGGARKDKGLGVYDPAKLEGLVWGASIQLAGKDLVVLKPTLADLHGTVRRKAQIITAKDASRIVWELGVGPGDRVLESGIGSGATTIALLHAVAPGGEVVVQELRDDFAEWATQNVEHAGLADGLTVCMGDLTEGLATDIEGLFNACLLDQPEADKALPHVVPVLAPGANLVAYCPQVSQMERTARAMAEQGLHGVRCLELMQRHWDVKEMGSRPSSGDIGHTAFLVMGRFAPHDG